MTRGPAPPPDAAARGEEDLSQLFARLVDLDASARAVGLAAVHDPTLRAKLTRMLSVDPADPRLATGWVLDDLGAGDVSDVPTPVQLGPFCVIRELGRGGMGVVYEAKEARLPRRVALKTLPSEFPDDAAVARFEAEAMAMASVAHPAVPGVLQLFRAGARPVLAMELVEGQPFLEAARAMHFDDRIRLLVELARAVEAIHQAGIVHRDLKPGNLLVGAGGTARIIDFGIAFHGGGFLPGAGTRAYMSAEQREGAPPRPADDVYSLGGIARVVLAGTEQALDGEDGFLSQAATTLPPSLVSVLERAVHNDPDRRTRTAADLADDLEAWLEAELLRMLASTAPEAGPGGDGALRRRAVDSTLAVLRRALETDVPANDLPLQQDALRRLVAWMDAGARAVSLHGLPGTAPERLLDAVLDRMGAALTWRVVTSDADLLGPLADALGVSATAPEVQAALRALGAAVIGVHGAMPSPADFAALLRAAPDVRWILAGPARLDVAGVRPLHVRGVPTDVAVEHVAERLRRAGLASDPDRLAAAVERIDGAPGLLDELAERATAVGAAGLARLDPADLAPHGWSALSATLDALDPTARAALASLVAMPDRAREEDVATVLGDAVPSLGSLAAVALIERRDDRIAVPIRVREAAHALLGDALLTAGRRRWLCWLPEAARRLGAAWLATASTLEDRVDDLAPHVADAAPLLGAEALRVVSANLSDALSILGHRDVRAVLDEAVLAATPDPLVSPQASLAWVHAVMRRRRRGDMTDVPTLRAIRLAADPSDGNLLSQVTHVEASRYAPGDQQPVVAIMRETWTRLRDHHQEAWGAWMIAVQASVSKGMGLPGTELLALAEDATAAIRTDAPELARVFASQAMAFAWIDHGRLAAGARLGQRVSDELAARGLVRIAASFSTYIGRAWAELGDLDRAEAMFERVVARGAHVHPPHALQWLALVDLARGHGDRARQHLEEARRRQPRMEHALLHHHQMCEALLAHSVGAHTEARVLYRGMLDTRTSQSPRRRSVALAGLVLLAEDEAQRASWADALQATARDHEDARAAADMALGGDAAAPDQPMSIMVRILSQIGSPHS